MLRKLSEKAGSHRELNPGHMANAAKLVHKFNCDLLSKQLALSANTDFESKAIYPFYS